MEQFGSQHRVGFLIGWDRERGERYYSTRERDETHESPGQCQKARLHGEHAMAEAEAERKVDIVQLYVMPNDIDGGKSEG